MIKFLLITFLVIYLSVKLAGFVIRLFLRSAGFTINANGRQAQKGHPRAADPRAEAQAQPKPDANRHVTDSLGDYVDYEEVK